MPNLLPEKPKVAENHSPVLAPVLAQTGDNERVSVITLDNQSQLSASCKPLENKDVRDDVITPDCSREDGPTRIRTENQGIMSHEDSSCKGLPNSSLGKISPSLSPPLVLDPELLAIAQAWERLPENMSAVIRSMATLTNATTQTSCLGKGRRGY